jgi:hypothetical protein
VQVHQREDSGGERIQSNTTISQMLPILLLAPGVFVNLVAMAMYPPVNSRRPMGAMIGIFLLPLALQLFRFLRRQPSSLKSWRRACIFSSVALMLLAILLFVNGRFDQSPPHQETTTVLRKSAIRGRRGTQYNLTVSSWRPGRSVEYFKVTSSVFNRCVVGKSVQVEVHAGYLGMPWHGGISPD